MRVVNYEFCRNVPCSQLRCACLLEGVTNAAQVRCLGRFCVEIQIWDLLNTKQQEMFSKPILILFCIFTLIVFFLVSFDIMRAKSKKPTCSHRR
jgi:hypothetical protein